jgi:ketosteroid isomerase-like protein
MTRLDDSVPSAIAGYFEADARRDTEAIVGLFTEDAVVIDEGGSWRGVDKIRAWREGPAAKYEYTTELFGADRTGDDEYLLTGRIDGNFPGGTAALKWRFTLAGDRIVQLEIAP